MKVAILANGWTGYLDASGRELARRGVELLVVHEESSPDVAFATHDLPHYAKTLVWAGEPDAAAAIAAVRDFAPDAALMHSWHRPAYRKVMRCLPDGTLRVLWMDNVWRGTAKQWAGRAVSRFYVQPIFDCVMVPSDRTEFFARRLGFAPENVIRGSLSADTSLFGSPERTREELSSRRTFVAVLRLVHHKGADVLADAYRRYRELTPEPWELALAGQGPLDSCFAGLDGVRALGFLQPAEIAGLMRESSCLINPSREEPYGLVLHEAALSGLPLLSTHFVGAAPTMVQDGQNGWIIPGGDAQALADAMHRMSTQPPGRLAEMSAISRQLAARLSSPGWARNLHEELEGRRGSVA